MKYGNLPKPFLSPYNPSSLYPPPQLQKYRNNEQGNLALISAQIEATGYGVWTRLEEIIELSRRMEYQKLGLVLCLGLRKEAAKTANILERKNFEVCSLICKVGSFPKEEIGLADEEKVRPGTREVICNPIAQAEFLNRANTDFNLILGLCVGHDTLFIQHSQAPVTYFAVKDRALGHNPLAAIYCQYFDKRLIPLQKV